MKTTALLLSSWAVLLSMLQATQGLRFDLQASLPDEHIFHCVSHYVTEATHVEIRVKVGAGANQRVGLEITDDGLPNPNTFSKKDSVVEEFKTAFETHSAGQVMICFSNVLSDGYQPEARFFRPVELDFKIGSETVDYDKMAEKEKLKPMEVELRRLEALVTEITDTMDHLKAREERMRNTNESTNARVQWFSTLTMFILVASGLWQIFYLKRFFKRKRLID